MMLKFSSTTNEIKFHRLVFNVEIYLVICYSFYKEGVDRVHVSVMWVFVVERISTAVIPTVASLWRLASSTRRSTTVL